MINGWLHTGDLGSIDNDGYLKISGRVNEMIVNSGGENIAPVPIENLLLSYDEIEQVMIYGHNRPFLVAIIIPSETTLSDNENILKENLQNILNNVNKDLSQTKKIRKFIFSKKGFSTDNSQLTPTLKIRRHVIAARYIDEINNLYKKSFF